MTVLKILTQPKYFILAIIIALTLIAFAAWLPNIHLITGVMTGSSMTLWQKTSLLAALLGSLRTNFTLFSLTLTIVTAVLAGIQISLLIYYFRQTIRIRQSMGMSALGIATSMLGVGCASCGSVVLTSFVGLGSATSIMGFLPFRGQEFSILGIGILLLAIRITVNKINASLAC